MRRTVPRRPWAHGALVAIAALALVQMGAGPAQEEERGAASQGAGNRRRSLVRGQPGRDEGRGGRASSSGWITRVSMPRRSWYRKQLVDEMSKAGVEKAEKLLDQSPGLDGDRAADDSRRRQSQGPARRPG